MVFNYTAIVFLLGVSLVTNINQFKSTGDYSDRYNALYEVNEDCSRNNRFLTILKDSLEENHKEDQREILAVRTKFRETASELQATQQAYGELEATYSYTLKALDTVKQEYDQLTVQHKGVLAQNEKLTQGNTEKEAVILANIALIDSLAEVNQLVIQERDAIEKAKASRLVHLGMVDIPYHCVLYMVVTMLIGVIYSQRQLQ